ncbi:hypothetical protein LSM04_005183 [Trypanosoma melophagium]|uniref:uncharacterized protein n=1 Tax=Trypanosoma melophagium TaxID=715481 RepID=UPI00351A626D|nr:hypothetical protein LSM04_005183 [Trypanosoma melophagium]
MVMRHVLCFLTIALWCVCSCVVIANPESLGSESSGIEGSVDMPSPSTPCPSDSSTETDASQCTGSIGGGDAVQKQLQPTEPENKEGLDGQSQVGSLSSGVKAELVKPTLKRDEAKEEGLEEKERKKEEAAAKAGNSTSSDDRKDDNDTSTQGDLNSNLQTIVRGDTGLQPQSTQQDISPKVPEVRETKDRESERTGAAPSNGSHGKGTEPEAGGQTQSQPTDHESISSTTLSQKSNLEANGIRKTREQDTTKNENTPATETTASTNVQHQKGAEPQAPAAGGSTPASPSTAINVEETTSDAPPGTSSTEGVKDTGTKSGGNAADKTTTTNNSANKESGTLNTPSNEESTTTTTTALPPTVPANNKKPNVKGDADSSSSISSVWVRVSLLIVVALACILV